MPLSPGTRFGPYEILDLIGSGGMGQVYRALDTRLQRTVAVKVLHAHLSENADFRERFEQEARTISQLNHPHICHLYDVGSAGGIGYLVMEHLIGRTLAACIAEGPIPYEQWLRYSLQIAGALEYAHGMGLVHRDLKPANIFITSEGHAKLLDFGLAKTRQLAEDATSISQADTVPLSPLRTSPGVAVGTIAYMSPEQARGEEVDGRSDLFSLGLLIYEMATGSCAFAGSSAAVVFEAVLNRQPTPISTRVPSVPFGVDLMLNRLLAKHPADRYPSAGELSLALEELRQTGRLTTSGRTAAVPRIPSIAVLPFANLTPEADNQYFSDGLSEDLISALGRLPDLQVASRTSAFRFRGSNLAIPEIGRQLKVQAILEGSVRRVGDRLRITAQLVSTVDGYSLWSGRYDRQVTDLFQIQDEITSAIVHTLLPTLKGQHSALIRRHSENLQAYELYLKGSRLWEQRTESSLWSSLECFRAAITLDPDYALAHAGVSNAFAILALNGFMPFHEGRAKAEAAVIRALELAPSLAEPHFSRGLATCIFGNQWAKAEAHFRVALEIEPRSSLLHTYLASLLAVQHRYPEAIATAVKVTELDPLSPFALATAGMAMHCSRDFEGALREALKAQQLQSNFAIGIWVQAVALRSLHRWEESIAAGEKLAAITRRSATFLGSLALTYGLAGKLDHARAIQRELEQRAAAGEYINPFCFLHVHLGLGDWDGVRASLQSYHDDGANCWSLEIGLGPVADQLLHDPVCASLLRQMGRVE